MSRFPTRTRIENKVPTPTVVQPTRPIEAAKPKPTASEKFYECIARIRIALAMAETARDEISGAVNIAYSEAPKYEYDALLSHKNTLTIECERLQNLLDWYTK